MIKSLFLTILLFAGSAFASEITHLRNDQTVPEHCQTNQVSDFFSPEMNYITYTRVSSRGSKFDFKYDISRGDIRRLWSIFKGSGELNGSDRQWLKEGESREHNYNLILDNYKKMDFDFKEEGQILEILALLEIKKDLDLSKYYITGSVAYSGNRSQNRIGELDLVIAEVETCKAITVGEVKISPKRLGKARSQLSRFKNFLDSEQGR